jgi:hypothetical protein
VYAAREVRVKDPWAEMSGRKERRRSVAIGGISMEIERMFLQDRVTRIWGDGFNNMKYWAAVKKTCTWRKEREKSKKGALGNPRGFVCAMRQELRLREIHQRDGGGKVFPLIWTRHIRKTSRTWFVEVYRNSSLATISRWVAIWACTLALDFCNNDRKILSHCRKGTLSLGG